jgi:hypothetical protein
MKKIPLILAGLPWAAMAHDGHGLGSTHWHATDVLGFVAVALFAAAAAWWSGRK